MDPIGMMEVQQMIASGHHPQTVAICQLFSAFLLLNFCEFEMFVLA